MAALSEKKCVPCESGAPALNAQAIAALLGAVSGWSLAHDTKSIHKTVTFKDWKDAHVFVDRVSDIAESENHHPDVQLSWGRVRVSLTTHSIGGLSENDFILAAKIDSI